MTIANKLARPELLDMVPYQSARRLFAGGEDFNNKVWLNANEAPGDGSYQITGECINRYPDFQPDNLINAYCQYSGVNKQQLLATRGADEGIELIIRTFCKAYQDSILICPPTYGMYAISAENHGASVIKVPLVNQVLDLEGLKTQVGKAKVVFLCSPGNPTGNLLPKAQIEAALTMFAENAIVVVDEAYIEFSPQDSVVNWLDRFPNLIVLRTLSKAFALAGLRCGFTLANADIIEMMSKVIAPYPISAPVAEMASDALSTQGIKTMASRVEDATKQRETLIEWLSMQPWCCKVYPSNANFVLFECQDKESVFNLLKEQNILIRDQSKQLQLDNCLRISIGSEAELDQLKQTLATSLNTSAELLTKEN